MKIQDATGVISLPLAWDMGANLGPLVFRGAVAHARAAEGTGAGNSIGDSVHLGRKHLPGFNGGAANWLPVPW
jgi:hypothetical protein